MIIEAVRVKNYRCILDETLQCDDLTALVGPNGAGKSAFLRALELFYSPSPHVDADDFYAKKAGAEISIAVRYRVVSREARELFSIYMQGETMTVERVLALEGGKVAHRTHGVRLQSPDFVAVRTTGTAADKKAAYDRLRESREYQDLPQWRNQAQGLEALMAWEENNPQKCAWIPDDGQFFGYKGVGQGYLNRFTRFLFIPAVRDAATDAAESKGSALTGLMDMVVRSVLANKKELVKLKDETQQRYEEIVDPRRVPELSHLAHRMTRTLRDYVPEARVRLEWQPLQDVNIPMPQADVKLVEDGYAAPVARTGHGLQRAFILTMLQHLAMAQASVASAPDATSEADAPVDAKLPSLVLAIEEPELYQHPNRQRHFARILAQLASGRTPGVAKKTQVVYATHSPLFVGIDRIPQIRLLRKVALDSSRPKVTRVVQTDLDQVAETLWEVDGRRGAQYSAATLLPRLQTLMTPWMNEGFFADVVVLVEGEDDRAAILGLARAQADIDLESEGFAVIPVGGKTNLDRPYLIFGQLGIPVYMVWDSDEGEGDAKPEDNHRLLRLVGQEPVDWPAIVHDRFTSFRRNLECALRSEIGEAVFDGLLEECQRELCILKRKHAIKNPCVIDMVLRGALKQGCKSNTMEQCLERILALKPRSGAVSIPPMM